MTSGWRSKMRLFSRTEPALLVNMSSYLVLLWPPPVMTHSDTNIAQTSVNRSMMMKSSRTYSWRDLQFSLHSKIVLHWSMVVFCSMSFQSSTATRLLGVQLSSFSRRSPSNKSNDDVSKWRQEHGLLWMLLLYNWLRCTVILDLWSVIWRAGEGTADGVTLVAHGNEFTGLLTELELPLTFGYSCDDVEFGVPSKSSEKSDSSSSCDRNAEAVLELGNLSVLWPCGHDASKLSLSRERRPASNILGVLSASVDINKGLKVQLSACAHLSPSELFMLGAGFRLGVGTLSGNSRAALSSSGEEPSWHRAATVVPIESADNPLGPVWRSAPPCFVARYGLLLIVGAYLHS